MRKREKQTVDGRKLNLGKKKRRRRASSVVIFEEEGRRHRIAFNSLYLFSFRPIIYEANGEALYNFTRGATRQLPIS